MIWVPIRTQFIVEPIVSRSLVQVQSPYSMNCLGLKGKEEGELLIHLEALKRAGQAALNQVEMKVKTSIVLDILKRRKNELCQVQQQG